MFRDRSGGRSESVEDKIVALQEVAATLSEANDEKDQKILDLEKQIKELKGAGNK